MWRYYGYYPSNTYNYGRGGYGNYYPYRRFNGINNGFIFNPSIRFNIFIGRRPFRWF